MTLQELEHIKQRTLTEQGMDKERKAPRVNVGMGTCGIKAGAVRVLEELRNKLEGNEEVYVTHVGCIGLCTCEPLVEILNHGGDSVIYGYVTPEKVERIVNEHIIGNRPVSEWVVAVSQR